MHIRIDTNFENDSETLALKCVNEDGEDIFLVKVLESGRVKKCKEEDIRGKTLEDLQSDKDDARTDDLFYLSHGQIESWNYVSRKEKNVEHAKEYYKENKEKIAEKQKQYYLENKEKIDEKRKQYKENNKEKIAEYYQANKKEIAEKQKQYYHKNKEKIKETQKKYREKNKGKRAEYYQKNKEKEAEQYKKYYEANKEKKAAQKKEWYHKNKEKINERRKQRRKENIEKSTPNLNTAVLGADHDQISNHSREENNEEMLLLHPSKKPRLRENSLEEDTPEIAFQNFSPIINETQITSVTVTPVTPSTTHTNILTSQFFQSTPLQTHSSSQVTNEAQSSTTDLRHPGEEEMLTEHPVKNQC